MTPAAVDTPARIRGTTPIRYRCGNAARRPRLDTFWHRLVRGVWRLRQRPDWAGFAGPDWADHIMQVAGHRPLPRQAGPIDRPLGSHCRQGRRLVVYLKRHYRLPWLSGLLALLGPAGLVAGRSGVGSPGMGRGEWPAGAVGGRLRRIDRPVGPSAELPRRRGIDRTCWPCTRRFPPLRSGCGRPTSPAGNAVCARKWPASSGRFTTATGFTRTCISATSTSPRRHPPRAGLGRPRADHRPAPPRPSSH